MKKSLLLTIVALIGAVCPMTVPAANIDLKAKTWTIPADRMKAGREHRVPLCEVAVALLDKLPQERDGEFLFIGARAGMPLSNMAMTSVLRRMKRGDITVHGFRSTFRDWAGDRTGFTHETIEFSLAHGITDKTEAAYRRSTSIEKRRRLMDAWGEYCAKSAVGGANVVNMKS